MTTISVIISTYNSPEWLEKVLWGYACQSDRDFELVVADDGSGPDTAHTITQFASVFGDRLKHVWHADRGYRKCAILNQAITAARGSYLIFTDGDCIPRHDFVAAHRVNAQPGFYLTGTYCRLPMTTSVAIGEDDIRSGRAFSMRWLTARGYAARRDWSKFLARPMRVDRLINRASPSKIRFHGNNASCFRSDAIRIGGFDERMGYGGEDHEFGYRLAHAGVQGKQVRYSALCLHLDHARGYVDEAIKSANMELIRQTHAEKRTFTEYGIGTIRSELMEETKEMA